MPYDAKLLRLDGKLSSAGNFRGTIDIAGPTLVIQQQVIQRRLASHGTTGGISFDTTT